MQTVAHHLKSPATAFSNEDLLRIEFRELMERFKLETPADVPQCILLFGPRTRIGRTLSNRQTGYVMNAASHVSYSLVNPEIRLCSK